MRTFKYIVVILSIVLTGCATTQPVKPVVMTQIVYKTKIVKVPVICKHEPVKCDFTGTGYTPTIKLLECIVTQKRVIESCDHNSKITTAK